MLAALKWVSGYALTIIISVPVNGLLISATWGWFVVPATGARQIGIAQGVGLAIFISIVGIIATAHQIKYDFGDEKDPARVAARGLGKVIGGGILGPLATLAIAWAWHTFVMGPISN